RANQGLHHVLDFVRIERSAWHVQTDVAADLVEAHGGKATVRCFELGPRVREHEQSLYPDPRAAEQVRLPNPKKIAQSRDVALRLRGGIADVGRIQRAGATQP